MGSSREESNQQSWAGKRIMFFFGEQPFLITIIEIVGVVSLLFSSSADRLFFSAYTTKTLICPDWKIPVVPVSQLGTPGRDKRGGPFVPGLATGTKGYLLSRLVTPTGTKGNASATWLAHPFVPVGVTNRDKMSLFSCFFFSILFLFQLYFCISIKLMYWNSVCMISTNIYIYIYTVTYIIFVLDSFHI